MDSTKMLAASMCSYHCKICSFMVPKRGKLISKKMCAYIHLYLLVNISVLYILFFSILFY